MKKTFFYLITVFAGLFVALLVLCVYSSNSGGSPEHVESGWNITAAKAYQMWEADTETVKIIDVRTRAEYALVGHPPMAFNIPLAFWTGRFDPLKKDYRMKVNPDFIKDVKNRFSTESTLLLLCRSGQRSRVAAKYLRNKGFSKVYNITDGFEGSPFPGRTGTLKTDASKNGWKSSGAPWTYELDPRLVYPPYPMARQKLPETGK